MSYQMEVSNSRTSKPTITYLFLVHIFSPGTRFLFSHVHMMDKIDDFPDQIKDEA